MKDTLYIKQGDSLTIIAEKTMNETEPNSFLELLINYHHYVVLIAWIILSIGVVFFVRKKLSKKLFLQGRIMIYYFIISSFSVLLLVGGKFDFLNEYLSGILTELIGIGFTVFIIDRIISYIGQKQEELYRALALKSCKMPIYTYCSIWINIYKSNNTNKPIMDFDNLETFFLSDDFHTAVTNYDFNTLIAPDKSYGKYYNGTVLNVSDKFQNILAKYASKLSIEDLKLLEHFGGGSYFHKIFAVNKFLTEVTFTTQTTTPSGTTTTQATRPFINSFKDLTKINFQKHFKTLLDLIDNYNKVIDNDYDEWNLNSLTNLETIVSMNDNESIEW